MSFATTFITGRAIFFSSLHAHPVAQTFLSFVSIAYELAPGNFWVTVYEDWKKVSAPCTITRCALEHFWLAIGCFEHIFAFGT